MKEATAEWVVSMLALYCALGALFALPFLMRGVLRIDEAARGTGLAFRLLILPGTVALWPLLPRLWLRRRL